jgi:uncharacterized protein YkwD
VGRKATELTERAGLPKGMCGHRHVWVGGSATPRPVPRKLTILTTALVALAIPATTSAHSRYAASRVSEASVALGHAPRLAVAASTRRAAATGDCANQDVVPTAANLVAFRAAIVCLHNQIRARNGLPLLKGNSRLRRAAESHSAEMVSAGYFEHTSPSGSTMVDRILGSGYVRANQGWILGENLEWGTGTLSTPRGAMDAWMNSPGHKANILKRAYRDMGIGVSLGIPGGGGNGATITVDFGVRR